MNFCRRGGLRHLLIASVALAFAANALAAERVAKETVTVDGGTRTYYLFIPARAKEGPAPLVILLHGSRSDGKSLLDKWEPQAKKDGIILAGPDSLHSELWGMHDDGPRFLRDLVEAIKTKHAIDTKRIYLFGHSSGATHALALAVLESEYFAAVAVHAGVLDRVWQPFLAQSPRKIPVAIWVGTRDPFFSVTNVRATRDALWNAGFVAELTEIQGHTHRYSERASEVNESAWAFLQKCQLAVDPKFQLYPPPSD